MISEQWILNNAEQSGRDRLSITIPELDWKDWEKP
jgi:hypothetical protein